MPKFFINFLWILLFGICICIYSDCVGIEYA